MGVASFIAGAEKGVRRWSEKVGQSFIQQLGLPLLSGPVDGQALLAGGARATTDGSELPTVLSKRLEFHIGLLRALAELECSGEGEPARQHIRHGRKTKAAAGHAATPTSGPGVAEIVAAVANVAPEGESWLDEERGEIKMGTRVQVAHLCDLARTLAPGGRLLPESLPLARRVGGARGTLTGAPDASGRVEVSFDDGFCAPLPPAALFALPTALLHPAQIVKGASMRIVESSW